MSYATTTRVRSQCASTATAGPAPFLIEDLVGSIRGAVDDALGDLGRFNLLAVGNTGAGKSSLINAVFGWPVARTGNGRPVTTGTTAYEHPHLPIAFFDTRGIEVGEDKTDIVDRLVGEIGARRQLSVEEQIHVAWYCLRWSDRRLEDGQAEVIREIAATGVPVVLVLTQVPENNGRYHPDALDFAESIVTMGLPLSPGSGVVLTAAIDDPWTGRAHGLKELLDKTFQVVPEGARHALTAAQQIDLKRKREASSRIVVEHASLAASAAAVPIPFADAVALAPIQVTMIARITAVWGLDVTKKTLANIIGSALLTTAATFAGRQLVGNLLKLVPGIGWWAGCALNATVATALTTAVGGAWSAVVEELAEEPETFAQMSDEEIRARFKQAFKRAQV